MMTGQQITGGLTQTQTCGPCPPPQGPHRLGVGCRFSNSNMFPDAAEAATEPFGLARRQPITPIRFFQSLYWNLFQAQACNGLDT